MTFNTKVRSLQLINHVFLLLGCVYLVQTSAWHLLWITLAAYFIMLPLGTVCGLHRLLAHKSYKTTKFWEYLLSVFSVIATIGSTITWVALHRYHHTNAERPNDPHSPYVNLDDPKNKKFNLIKAFKSWVGLWKVNSIPPRYVIDLIHDPFHAFIHKNYFWLIFLYCAALFIVDPWLVIFAYCIPACLALHATSVIIVIAHIHGYRTHQISDKSTNTWIGSLITLGDGWHNNHHANPGNWTTQEKWWEVDPMAWVIKCIKTH